MGWSNVQITVGARHFSLVEGWILSVKEVALPEIASRLKREACCFAVTCDFTLRNE